jgi:DNA-binding transcriptional regulator YhcF (GntR family)
MKPLIPHDASSAILAAGADSDREDQSLHDEILTRLRDHIVEGNIPDGGRVPERQLCEMLGISRTPLREALKVLASEGLVELLPNRGARVRQLSEHDLAELFDVMGGLEGLAGRLACENITDAEIAEIERLHYEMYGFYLRRDMHGYFRINQLIHQTSPDGSAGFATPPILPASESDGAKRCANTKPFWTRYVAAPVANSATSCLYICATSGPPPLNI